MKIIRLTKTLDISDVNALHRHGFDQVLDLRVHEQGYGPRPIEEALFLTLRRAMIGYEQDPELSQVLLTSKRIQDQEWETLLLCLERAKKSVLILADVPAAIAPALQMGLGHAVEVDLWRELMQTPALAA